MKKIALTTLLILSILASISVPALAAAPDHFKDVPANHWAHVQIERAYADGVMAGTSGNAANYTGVFSPAGTLTMAQFLTIMGRAFYPDEMQAEIDAGHTSPWYLPAYNVAWNHGLFVMTSGTPAIAQNITRYDMASVMTNVMEDLGVQMPTKSELEAVQTKIGDFAQCPMMYEDAVRTVFALGLISGTDSKGTFAGENFMNRAQAAVVYGRMKDYVESQGGTTEPTPDPEPADVFDFNFSDYATVQDFANAINKATPAYREGYLTNGKPITDDSIKEFLEKIKEILPDGTTWAGGSKYSYASPKFSGGSGCNSYAYLLSDWMFGEDAPLVKNTYQGNIAGSIKIGDTIWGTDETTGYNHVLVITNINSSSFEATSGNNGSNTNKTVSWKNIGFLDNSITLEVTVYSRY